MTHPSNSDNLLVSIIDDDFEMRSSLVDLVRSAGYGAAAFSSAEAFLRAPELWISQCIVTDIQMPGLDGFELKQRLDEGCMTAPVIMMTGQVDDAAADKALASGAFCFLRKPFKPEELLRCVMRSLEH